MTFFFTSITIVLILKIEKNICNYCFHNGPEILKSPSQINLWKWILKNLFHELLFSEKWKEKIPWNWFQILSEFFGLDFFIYIFWPAVNILKYCNNIHLSHVNQLLHILVDMQNSWNHKYNVSSERFFITKIFTTKLASIKSFSNIVILFLQRNFEVKNCFFLFPNWL